MGWLGSGNVTAFQQFLLGNLVICRNIERVHSCTQTGTDGVCSQTLGCKWGLVCSQLCTLNITKRWSLYWKIWARTTLTLAWASTRAARQTQLDPWLQTHVNKSHTLATNLLGFLTLFCLVLRILLGALVKVKEEMARLQQ